MEDEIPRPRFTGIFVPVEILNLNLSPLEQMILSLIEMFYCSDLNGFTESNKKIANILKVKENSVAKSLTYLRQLGLIKDVTFDGRKRVIKTTLKEVLNDG